MRKWTIFFSGQHGLLTYLTELGHNAEKLAIDEAIMKLDNARVVQVAQQVSFVHSVHRLIWLQLAHRYLLQNFPTM